MYSYHIKDAYFTNAEKYLGTKCTNLMSNKEGGGYRPHFLCIEDDNNPSVIWAVPQSSQVEKYRRLVERKTERFGRCDTIVIGRFAGKDCAFLIQNMFPISRAYIDHVHTINGQAVSIHKKLAQEIQSKAKRTLNIYRRNKNILFADVDKLYAMIESELSANPITNH